MHFHLLVVQSEARTACYWCEGKCFCLLYSSELWLFNLLPMKGTHVFTSLSACEHVFICVCRNTHYSNAQEVDETVSLSWCAAGLQTSYVCMKVCTMAHTHTHTHRHTDTHTHQAQVHTCMVCIPWSSILVSLFSSVCLHCVQVHSSEWDQ